MIKISNLSKSYGENAVLENINLQIKKGEVLALIGFSGSGKSTLLKIIAGLEDYDSGTVELGSEKIGMAFQYSALFDSLNIADNVAFPLCYGKQARTDLNEEELFKIVSNKLSTVGLSGVETLSPSELSGGMKKRVSFARAIVNDPELILYDEPTAG